MWEVKRTCLQEHSIGVITVFKETVRFSNTKLVYDFKSMDGGFCRKKYGKNVVIPGMEPTGHYWFNLGAYLQDNGI